MAPVGRGEMLLALVVALCLSATTTEAQLRVGFYSCICPQAELIVRQEVNKAVRANPGIAAGLLRLHFHDCFVRGCDASVLIDSTRGNTAEKDTIPNSSLRGFEVIDSAKRRLEAVCRRKVSCSDILAFAARDSIAHYKGIAYQVPAGRRDGRVSKAAEVIDLPPPMFNLTLLTPFFTKKGLSQDDMIVLSGAHTVGISHCPSFAARLYNFSGAGTTDPSLDCGYAAQLKRRCPPRSNNVVPMDPPSPITFDTSYYRNLLVNRGLFTSDQTLMSTRATAAKVRQLAGNPWLFQTKFAAAMVKMGNIGVLSGRKGEIRANCRRMN
ncbi:hypothetical protein Cni_G04257 [Canna indica]|uniref:Peroxidase n=1 Tax=Canna indica TaxID=4628 RepID=A0AAQ3Q229_9LILI|nr:hypothetical protein Cni_G04257 [Canna indica]